MGLEVVERRLMDLVPAPAVRLMKSRVKSRPGVDSVQLSTHNHYHPAHYLCLLFCELDDSGCVLTKGTGHPMSCLAITFTTQQINSKRRIFAWLYCLAALGVNLLSQPPNTTKDFLYLLPTSLSSFGWVGRRERGRYR